MWVKITLPGLNQFNIAQDDIHISLQVITWMPITNNNTKNQNKYKNTVYLSYENLVLFLRP